MAVLTIDPDWTSAGEPFRHTWEGVVNVDQFRWLVRGDMQDQLRTAHREIGARHVRAVGMLDDELRVLTRDPVQWRSEAAIHTEPNWQINTMIIERLLGIGINPMITTCFMPGAMASGNRTVFETRARISRPRDMAEWRKLIQHLARHLISHFGAETVRNFYFEIWNEPNLENSFFEGTQADFFELYRQTVTALKEVDAGLKCGGPSTARAEWIPEFIAFCREHSIEPEYLIGHVYNNDSASQPLSPFDGPQEDKTSTSPHFASGVIRGTRKFLDEVGFKGEVHWNEWGRSWFPCEPIRETANEAAFIAKTMAEVSQLGDYFAYWCLSDIYDQVGYGRTAFHGNYGMVNLQGLRKPSYKAFQLLSLLGDRRVAVKTGGGDQLTHAMATTSADGRAQQVLVYAYDQTDHPATRNITVRLSVPERAGNVQLHRVTATENNILADWRDLGAPDYLKHPVRKELEDRNATRSTLDFRREGGQITFSLDAPGIALLTTGDVQSQNPSQNSRD
jgi:xylan 1,4-beta-xylosidase